jgi:hypothetical protein
MNQLKLTSCWHYDNSFKLIALKLHSGCSYIVVIELQKLHMYTFHIWWVAFVVTNGTCSIAFALRKYAKLQWIATGHCNSKTQIQS